MVTLLYEEWWDIVSYGNLETVKVTIWQHMVSKKLPYDTNGLPYDVYMGDSRPQCIWLYMTIIIFDFVIVNMS